MHLKTALLKLWFSKCKMLFRKLYLIRWPVEMQSWLDTLSLYQFFSCMFVLIMTVQNFCLGAMKEFFLHNRGLEERFFQICWWEKNKKGICCNVITFFFLCVMASVWSKKLCPLLEVNFVYLDWIITLSREPCVVIFALSFLLLLSFFRQLLITFWCRT